MFDVLIIGTGVAGLTSAIKLAESGAKVAIVTREERPEHTNTFWAQGGIIYTNETDEEFVDDIVKASAETSNLEAARISSRSSDIFKRDF